MNNKADCHCADCHCVEDGLPVGEHSEFCPNNSLFGSRPQLAFVHNIYRDEEEYAAVVRRIFRLLRANDFNAAPLSERLLPGPVESRWLRESDVVLILARPNEVKRLNASVQSELAGEKEGHRGPIADLIAEVRDAGWGCKYCGGPNGTCSSCLACAAECELEYLNRKINEKE